MSQVRSRSIAPFEGPDEDPDAVAGHGEPAHHSRHAHQRWILSITALGIVFGDIGTSPLYAFQVAMGATHPGSHGAVAADPASVLGVVSLIFWAIILIVAVKYVSIVMRADNEGEGGILALLSLVMRQRPEDRRRAAPWVLVLGVVGAAFIYGDGVITPAISVLSAMEGLDVAAPEIRHWILPLTVLVLLALFAIQRRGTGKIGRLFGPVMVVWFLAIAVLGILQVVRTPAILAAVNPAYAAGFLARGGAALLPVLGAAFLALTGAEALYADMGHLGARPIRRAWFGLVLPALALSYFGQGALLLARPEAADNPFFNQAPSWAALPLVVLATLATIIASQALISGAFSLTRQAIQMRLLPRMHIRPTSGEHRGQIYLSVVNWALMAGSIAVVLGFRSSGSLAAAYGIAVSGTMLVTSVLLFSIVRQRWRWPLAAALLLIGVFAFIDGLFLIANATKIAQGGWLPLVVGAVLAAMMLIWRGGTIEVQKRLEHMAVPFDRFFASLSETLVTRVPGTAVVLTRSLQHASPVLVQQVRHNRVLHEHVVLLTILPTGRPVVPARERLEISDLGQGFHRVIAKTGFMQTPDLAAYIRGGARMGLKFCEGNIHYMVAYEHISRRPHKPHFPILLWHVFSAMSKTGVRLTDFLRIPEKQVLEIGIKVEI